MHTAELHGVFTYLVVAVAQPLAEQEGSTPQTGKANDGVNDAAEDRILASKQPRNQVKLKDSYETPVSAAND